jgi:putative ABC transport system permease protein
LYYTPTSFDRGEAFALTNTYPDKGHGSFNMLAVSVPTQLLHPTITEGRWLDGGSAREVVLNQLARGLSSSANIGDSVSLVVDGKVTRWRVVGFSEDVGSAAAAYVSLSSVRAALNSDGVNMIRIAYVNRTQDYAMLKNREVEALLVSQGISVEANIPVWLLHNAIAGHMKVLINSLMTIAILMAVVGIIGLMSTMSINTLERTREIGVMRAIGATPARIKKLIVGEGLIVGSLSVSIALALSLVLSSHIGELIGNMAFRTPLSLAISGVAVVTWIALILFGSYVATLYPARKAIGITTRDALSYE